jgi:hypothetical protein
MARISVTQFRACLTWVYRVVAVLCSQTAALGAPPSLAPPVREGPWVRPAAEGPAQPIWGHAHGLRIGLAPLPGPRGLLRVYTPYLGHPEGRMINFLAVEPIVVGQRERGFSELERSELDRTRGKRFWSLERPEDVAPRRPEFPARGSIRRNGSVEELSVYIQIEPFRNGAHVYLRLTFLADRPYEVKIATFAHPDSAPLDFCIVTATMGNYARLRRLHLGNRVVTASELWPHFQGPGFAPHRSFPLRELFRDRASGVWVAAMPDEADPSRAPYAPGTPKGWQYEGKVGTQYWRCEQPPPDLRAQVNGRTEYWATRSPIPGGISFENLELVCGFRQGQEFWFGVTPCTAEELYQSASAAHPVPKEKQQTGS